MVCHYHHLLIHSTIPPEQSPLQDTLGGNEVLVVPKKLDVVVQLAILKH